jgi:hypothetical protein
MVKVKLIEATLPNLGKTRIYFYIDSIQILDYFGKREISRLERIPHLGIASKAFTGVNHTRCEYTLLQCATAGLIAKIHKNDAEINLASKVPLQGSSEPVSSGEDLLKAWFLLSAIGRPQWTFGTERALINMLHESSEFRIWLLTMIRDKELKAWASIVIANRDYSNFHYVISVVRIYLENGNRRHRARMLAILRNLLLPIASIFPEKLEQRYKIYRLRQLFNRIRHLTMLAIDSHHSHSSIKTQLHHALNDASIVRASTTGADADELQLRLVAGWTAESLYLSPHAVMLLAKYQQIGANKLRKGLPKALNDSASIKGYFNNVIAQGFGEPHTGKYVHLIRIRLNEFEIRTSGFISVINIIREVGIEGDAAVSVEHNPALRVYYLDVFIQDNTYPQKIGSYYFLLFKWLLRHFEARAIWTIRNVMGPGNINELLLDQRKRDRVEKYLRTREDIIFEIFRTAVQTMLPENWVLGIHNRVPDRENAPTLVFRTKQAGYQNIHNEALFDDELRLAGENGDRKLEIQLLQKVFNETDGALVVTPPYKIVIYDEYGKMKDEWDGVILSVDGDLMRIYIVESKNVKGGPKAIADNAFRQLKDTVKIMNSRFKLYYSRQRVLGLGAYATFECRTT